MGNKVLITGATGNVGIEVIKSLLNLGTGLEILAGVRDVEKESGKFGQGAVKAVYFDFEQISMFSTYLEKIRILFLLRPPQI